MLALEKYKFIPSFIAVRYLWSIYHREKSHSETSDHPAQRPAEKTGRWVLWHRSAFWDSTDAWRLRDYRRKMKEQDWALEDPPRGERKKRTHGDVGGSTVSGAWEGFQWRAVANWGPGGQANPKIHPERPGFGWRSGHPGVYVGARSYQRTWETCISLPHSLSCQDLETGVWDRSHWNPQISQIKAFSPQPPASCCKY